MPEKESLMVKNNIYYFCERFDNETTKPAIEFIIEKNLIFDDEKPDHILLIINSQGGTANSTIALIDIMKGSSIPIHTLGLGCIASSGLLVFMSGKKGERTITPNTSILSHQYSWGTIGKEHELFSFQKGLELKTERMLNLYKECTNLNETKIREVLLPAHDVWLSAKEAIRYGIADKIKKTF